MKTSFFLCCYPAGGRNFPSTEGDLYTIRSCGGGTGQHLSVRLTERFFSVSLYVGKKKAPKMRDWRSLQATTTSGSNKEIKCVPPSLSTQKRSGTGQWVGNQQSGGSQWTYYWHLGDGRGPPFDVERGSKDEEERADWNWSETMALYRICAGLIHSKRAPSRVVFY